MQAAKGIKAPSLTVFMGNLDSKVTERHLYELGCQAGPVQHVKVQHDAETNKKGFGFITYAGLDSAIYCLGLYRGLLSLFGLPVNVNFANKEVPADDISEQHTALLDKVKRMLAATGAEQNIQGAGPARRQQQSQRYAPYGVPHSRHARDNRQQQQRGAGAGYNDADREYADAGKDYQDRGNGYAGAYGTEQYGRAGSGDYSTAYAGAYGAAAGSSYAAPAPQQQQQQQQVPVPVADWQTRLAAAAAQAVAQIEQPAASQYTAQGYQAGTQQQQYVQPPPPQQQQQYTYAQPPPPQQPQQQVVTAAGGYASSGWGLSVQHQQVQHTAPVQQYQSSLPQAITSQAYSYQPQLQQQQQAQLYASAPAAAQAAAGIVMQQPQYTWQQQQQYQPALQQQPQQVVLQVAQQPGAVPQQVIMQVPQQQQQQQAAGQIVYYY